MHNECERAALPLDVEERVGAKPKRILDLTLLAPARQTTQIPVSCVEAGRWGYSSGDLRTPMRAQSVTAAVAATYETHQADVAAFVEALPPVARQLGRCSPSLAG